MQDLRAHWESGVVIMSDLHPPVNNENAMYLFLANAFRFHLLQLLHSTYAKNLHSTYAKNLSLRVLLSLGRYPAQRAGDCNFSHKS